MKRLTLLSLIALVSLSLIIPAITWAKCDPRIKEANAAISKAEKDKSATADAIKKAKGLATEAAKLRDAGKHDDGLAKANEALGLVTKK